MKVLKLITTLESVLEKYGDIPVKTFDLDRDMEEITEVDIVIEDTAYVYVG